MPKPAGRVELGWNPDLGKLIGLTNLFVGCRNRIAVTGAPRPISFREASDRFAEKTILLGSSEGKHWRWVELGEGCGPSISSRLRERQT
jgi:hypothetical protein